MSLLGEGADDNQYFVLAFRARRESKSPSHHVSQQRCASSNPRAAIINVTVGG